MKRLLLFVFAFFLSAKVFGAPSNTMSISPAAVDATTIEAS